METESKEIVTIATTADDDNWIFERGERFSCTFEFDDGRIFLYYVNC